MQGKEVKNYQSFVKRVIFIFALSMLILIVTPMRTNAATTWTTKDKLNASIDGTTLTISKNNDTNTAIIYNPFDNADTTVKQYQNEITEIKINNGITSIENAVFNGFSKLEKITIPSSVNFIDIFDYYGSISTPFPSKGSSFKEINVLSGNSTYSSRDGALYNKDKTELISCPVGKTDITIMNTVTTIKSTALRGCANLKELTFNSKSTIELEDNKIFEDCPTDLTIYRYKGVNFSLNRQTWTTNKTVVDMYDVIYHYYTKANSDDDQEVTQVFKNGENLLNITNAYVESGYTLAGWTKNTSRYLSVSKDYSNAQKSVTFDETSYTINLYPIWKRTATFYSSNKKDQIAKTVEQLYDPRYDQKYIITETDVPKPVDCQDTAWEAYGWRKDEEADISSGVLYTLSNPTAITSSAKEYYAVYTKNINFYSGTGTTSLVKATYNSAGNFKVKSPNSSSMSNWTFEGWSKKTTLDANETGLYEAGAEITDNFGNFYGVYKRDITVKYDGNGATSGTVADSTYSQRYKSTVGSTTNNIKLPSQNEFTRTGYTFDKWAESTSSSAVTYEAGTTYQLNSETAPGTTKTFYATWTPNIYKLTLDNQNPTTAGTIALWEKYDKGIYSDQECTKTISSITVPKKTGYTFGGYYTSKSYNDDEQLINASGRINFTNKNFTSTKTLYAKWIENTVTLYFYPNGGAQGGNDSNSGKEITEGNYVGASTMVQTIKYTDKDVEACNVWDVLSMFNRVGYHIDTDDAWRIDSSSSSTYLTQSTYNFKKLLEEKDKSIVMKLYANWKANTYTVIYDKNDEDATGTMNNSTHSFGTSTYLTSLGYSNPGKTFTGWNTESDGTGQGYDNRAKAGELTYVNGAEITLYAQWIPNTNTKYTVKHWQQKLTGDANTYNSTNYSLKDTESLTGTTGESVTPEVKNYEGFNSPKIQKITIQGDGKAEVNYYYTRKSYKYTLGEGSNISTTGSTATGKYLYGATITLKATVDKGYTFSQWTSSNTDLVENKTSTSTTFKMPAGNIKMTPSTTANTSTTYTVKHWQQNVNGDATKQDSSNYTVVKADSQTLTGTTGEKVTPKVNSYTGFTSPTSQTATIGGDGKTEINYYYTRNSYTYTLGEGSNISTTGSTDTGEYFYGATITLKATVDKGYTFSQWTSSNTDLVANQTIASTKFTMPAGNITMTPSTTANASTKYTVKHWQQKVTGDANTYNSTNYSLKDTESLTGTTGEVISPEVKIYDGFTSPSVKTETISGDGTTVVNYYYTRNRYQYTLVEAENIDLKDSTATGEYLYGATIKLNASVNKGYTFEKWTSSNTDLVEDQSKASTTFLMPAGNIVMIPSATPNDNTQYTVKHWQQKLAGDATKQDSSNYEEVSKDRQTLTGTTGEKVTLEVNTYEGFTSPSIKTETISGDGTTVVNYYYTRNKYQYTLGSGSNISTAGSTATGEYLYGTTIKLSATVDSGYTFNEWTSSNTDLVADQTRTSATFIMPAGDITMTPSTTANANTKYTVIHWQQKIDGIANRHDTTNYVTVTADKQTLLGTTGDEVTPEVKSYEGFTSPSQETVTISGDGTTVVNYYYTRNKYQYTLGSGSNISTAGSTATGEYLYGATIKLSATVDSGYTFNEWTSSNTDLVADQTRTSATFTMPAGDITMTPSTSANSNIKYTVQHWQQKVDGDASTHNTTNYAIVTADKQILLGTAGTSVTPEVKNYDGFTSPSQQTVTISGDGKTEINYYYTRKSYNFTLGSGSNISTVGSTATGEYIYGTKITLNATVDSGYTFKQWTSSNTDLVGNKISKQASFEMPAGNIAMTPSTTANDNIGYKVNHFQQALSGDDKYTLKDSYSLKGSAGEIVIPEVKNYEGFTSPSQETVAISGDGKTVVNYYYTRNKYQYTLGSGSNISTAGSTATGEYLYGATIKLSATVDSGYTFKQWTSSNIELVGNKTSKTTTFTMPAGDITMTPTLKEETDGVTVEIKENPQTIKASTEINETQYIIVEKKTITQNLLNDLEPDTEDCNLVIKDKNSNVLSDTDVVKTTQTIEVEGSEGSTNMVVIVKGDVNSDGVVNLADIVKLNNYRINRAKSEVYWTEAERIAFKSLIDSNVTNSEIVTITLRDIAILNNCRIN